MCIQVSAGVGQCCFNDAGEVRSSAKTRCASTHVAEPRGSKLEQRADARVRTWSPFALPRGFGRISKVVVWGFLCREEGHSALALGFVSKTFFSSPH